MLLWSIYKFETRESLKLTNIVRNRKNESKAFGLSQKYCHSAFTELFLCTIELVHTLESFCTSYISIMCFLLFQLFVVPTFCCTRKCNIRWTLATKRCEYWGDNNNIWKVVLQEKYANVRACVAGQIHDSSPIDFVSGLGAYFVSTVVLNSKRSAVSNAIFPVMTQAVAKLINSFFFREFNAQRDDYWRTLYQSAVSNCNTSDLLIVELSKIYSPLFINFFQYSHRTNSLVMRHRECTYT
jgi:hypothetical protein